MADTINADYTSMPCSDCGKTGVAFLKHWGPLVPSGSVGYFCKQDFDARVAEGSKGLPPRPLGTDPVVMER